MAVFHPWYFTRLDTGVAEAFPQNPLNHTPMEPPTGIQVVPVLFGDQPLLTQVQQPQHEWSFGGPIMNKAHHDFMYRWVYTITVRKRVQDHFGRGVTIATLGMSYTPDVNNVGRYWNGEYEVRVQNLGPVSSATVGDIWS